MIVVIIVIVIIVIRQLVIAIMEEMVLELFKAVMRDDAAAVETLAKSGVEVHTAKNKGGLTALQLATDRGKKGVKDYLQGSGKTAAKSSAKAAAKPAAGAAASGGALDENVLQLFRAVMQDDIQALQQAVAAGVDVQAARNKAGLSALQLATERGKEGVKKHLEQLLGAPGADKPAAVRATSVRAYDDTGHRLFCKECLCFNTALSSYALTCALLRRPPLRPRLPPPRRTPRTRLCWRSSAA